MAEFNSKEQRLTLKVVFYGPALSGKTTNLTMLHDRLKTELKGDMMVLETQNDRTLFFDFLPLGIRAPSGLLIKFKLFTVPGQVVHDSTRKAVLSRSDGVIFVADSQKNQIANNAEAFQNLELNARRVGLDFETLPLVVQFNKRDLPDIVPEEELRERWSATPWPLIFSAALQGVGVTETFSAMMNQLYDHIAPIYELDRRHQLSRQSFVDQMIHGIRTE